MTPVTRELNPEDSRIARPGTKSIGTSFRFCTPAPRRIWKCAVKIGSVYETPFKPPSSCRRSARRTRLDYFFLNPLWWWREAKVQGLCCCSNTFGEGRALAWCVYAFTPLSNDSLEFYLLFFIALIFWPKPTMCCDFTKVLRAVATFPNPEPPTDPECSYI